MTSTWWIELLKYLHLAKWCIFENLAILFRSYRYISYATREKGRLKLEGGVNRSVPYPISLRSAPCSHSAVFWDFHWGWFLVMKTCPSSPQSWCWWIPIIFDVWHSAVNRCRVVARDVSIHTPPEARITLCAGNVCMSEHELKMQLEVAFIADCSFNSFPPTHVSSWSNIKYRLVAYQLIPRATKPPTLTVLSPFLCFDSRSN